MPPIPKRVEDRLIAGARGAANYGSVKSQPMTPSPPTHDPFAAHSAGNRDIELEFNRGVFVARTNVVLNAEPDARYEIRFETDVKFTGNNTYVDFWIIDAATGKAVTAITRASVGGGSGWTFIPIFIPAG